jgi:hypothetical protein
MNDRQGALLILATEKKKILLDRYRETSSEATSWVPAVLSSGGYAALVLIRVTRKYN